MAGSVVKSVSFPKDVMDDLNDMARGQKRPRSQVLADAVRRYYGVWILEREQSVGRGYARKLGIKDESDIYRRLGL